MKKVRFKLLKLDIIFVLTVPQFIKKVIQFLKVYESKFIISYKHKEILCHRFASVSIQSEHTNKNIAVLINLSSNTVKFIVIAHSL